jgi:cytochrome b
MGKRSGGRTVAVWDLPTRLFHWLLVCLVAVSFATVEIGGNAMRVHTWSGFTILALVLFRVVWGFFGSTPSRFGTFLVGPRRVIAYALALLRPDGPHHLTHNPLGGWSVVAMLAVMLLQAATGLFASDDIMTQGPLNRHVSSGVGRLLTEIHELNAGVILALAAVHLAAVLFHLVYKQDNLIRPMITGRKPWTGPAEEIRMAPLWLAAVVAALAAGAVCLLVS